MNHPKPRPSVPRPVHLALVTPRCAWDSLCAEASSHSKRCCPELRLSSRNRSPYDAALAVSDGLWRADSITSTCRRWLLSKAHNIRPKIYPLRTRPGLVRPLVLFA